MNIKYLLAIAALAVGINACDNPGDGGGTPPQEVINIVRYVLHDSTNMQDSAVFTFIDGDGPAGAEVPSITGDTLKANTTYLGRIELYRVTRNGVDSLTMINQAIIDAGTAHQFFYLSTENVPVEIETTDKDANNKPLGIESKVRVGSVSNPATGILNVILSHYDEVGSKNGVDPSDESDIEIDFPVTVQ